MDAAVALPGAYVYELVSLCTRWGVTAEAVLEGSGISLAALKDPATRLSLAQCAGVVERAQTLTDQPALAFLLGMQMRLSWHGFLGFAAMTASTVREALEIAQSFSLTRTAAFGLSSYVEGDVAAVVLDERVPLGALREFAVTALLVGIGQIARDLTGKNLTGVAECAFPAPAYAAHLVQRGSYRAHRSIVFGQPSHRLVFDASVLELPIVTADPVAMQLARAQCDRELSELAETGGLVGRVRRLISREDAGMRGLDDVAAELHLSTRTLKRRMAEQGTTFSEELEQVRRQRALLLLANRLLTIASVADRLGYSDVANFTRAFRRWTGQTPAAYRAT